MRPAWFSMVCAKDKGARLLSYRCMTVRGTLAQHCTAKVVKANTFRKELGACSAARVRLLAGRQAWELKGQQNMLFLANITLSSFALSHSACHNRHSLCR